jgi:hypothetical protein
MRNCVKTNQTIQITASRLAKLQQNQKSRENLHLTGWNFFKAAPDSATHSAESTCESGLSFERS